MILQHLTKERDSLFANLTELIPTRVCRPVTVQNSKRGKTFLPSTGTHSNSQPSCIMAAAMISGNVEIPSIATALDREVILLLAFQICPRRVNDPTFGKPVFVVRTSRVEYKGL